MTKALTAALVAITLIFAAPVSSRGAAVKLKILTTVFPVYQLTKNVVQGRAGVEVEPMLPGSLGCPHDYILTAADMRKIVSADVLVVNGLGLEEFAGKPVERANPKIRVVDASNGLDGLIRHVEKGASVVNPHIFSSPAMAAKMALTIARGLSEIDPGGEKVYTANAQEYSRRMEALAARFSSLGRKISGRRVAAQHEIFDYLARDAGLEIVALVQPHGGQEPSAAKMGKVVETIKKSGAKAILTEPQYSQRAAQAIGREAMIEAVMIDPVASGPPNAPMDYFETKMNENLKILERVLGAR